MYGLVDADMTDASNDLDTLYSVVAFGTTLIGVAGLGAGVPGEVIDPIVLGGALVVGVISIYWLLSGPRTEGSD